MAHIPVEKKAGTPWWLWLLALLVLIPLLAFFLFGAFDGDDDDMVAEERTEAVVDVDEPVVQEVYAGTIEGLGALVAAEGAASVAGRRVDLDNVRVRGLSGDSTFVVSPAGADDRFVVVMRGMGESQTGDGTGSDGMYNVDEGDVVSIEGMVVDAASTLPRDAWGMNEGDIVDSFYIRATSLDK